MQTESGCMLVIFRAMLALLMALPRLFNRPKDITLNP
jgi:hypothetical protein